MFQSTPPMQGATSAFNMEKADFMGFNPRPLCRERLFRPTIIQTKTACFNPRPLCRERRYSKHDAESADHVSIHAPYAGSDYLMLSTTWRPTLFQSTPPMQGATMPQAKETRKLLFQSTPPMQGATQHGICDSTYAMFQSTPPMQGAT